MKLIATALGTNALSGVMSGDTLHFDNIHTGDKIRRKNTNEMLLDYTICSTPITVSTLDGSTNIKARITNTTSKPQIITELGVRGHNSTLDGIIMHVDMSEAPLLLQCGEVHDVSLLMQLSTTTDATHDLGNNSDYGDIRLFLNGLLGVPQTVLVDNLPDSTDNWGWFDGGEIKKTEYPDLWEAVKADVEFAVDAISGGIWDYLGVSSSRSYYGWYKGTTEDYFRKPMAMNDTFFRPTPYRKMQGVYMNCSIQSHTHGASSASAGGHNHTTNSQGGHSHSFYLGGNGEGDHVNMPSASDAATNYHNYTTNTAGAHTHTSTTSGAHTHGITVDNYGGVETTPTNIAVRLFALLRIRGV